VLRAGLLVAAPVVVVFVAVLELAGAPAAGEDVGPAATVAGDCLLGAGLCRVLDPEEPAPPGALLLLRGRPRGLGPGLLVGGA
jgi:hypothetical protein